METTVIEEISEKEKELAERLRSCCSPWGVERQSMLATSASILLEMGRLYMEKAKQSSGMLQKVMFIKCAALICGARVRFGSYGSGKKGVEDCRKAFKEMSGILLSICNAKTPNKESPLAFAEQLASLLRRAKEEDKISIRKKLTPIDDTVPDSELVMKQEEKIQLIRSFLEKSTDMYKMSLKDVAIYCLDILGDPPCKFSIVGLGSLARGEATLYSDFEHVILLEDGIDDSPHGEIREYFRWYTVVFHVIIIGFGETFIPTVGVKSLNDLNSEDKAKNWFFDIWTPGGISFDGRFPHACKTPLGKQEASSNRKHVVELIQPVDKMLEFLTKEEDFKNGYHLRDILVRTCLVHGDSDIYEDFKLKRAAIVTTETRDREVMEQTEMIVKNVNSFLNLTTDVWNTTNAEQIKNFFYRPVSVLVGCLHRFFGEAADISNLDFISWLRGQPRMSTLAEYLHNLQYAIAVANEIRLKVYAAAGKQRQKMSPQEIYKFVGRRCVTGCLRTVYRLALVFRLVWQDHGGFVGLSRSLFSVAHLHLFEPNAYFELQIPTLFGYHHDASAVYDEMVQGKEMHHLPAYSYVELGMSCPEKSEEYFLMAEKLLVDSKLGELSFEYVRSMSSIHYHRKCYQQAFDLIEKWAGRRQKEETNVEKQQYFFLKALNLNCMPHIMTPLEVINYTSKELEENTSIHLKLLLKVTQADAYLKEEVKDLMKAKLVLRETVRLCKDHVGEIENNNLKPVSVLVEYIFDIQLMRDWKKDAMSTVELWDMLQGTRERDTPDKDMMSQLNAPWIARKGFYAPFIKEAMMRAAQTDKLGNELVKVLLHRGIPVISERRSFFASLSGEHLKLNKVYDALNVAIQMYFKMIHFESYYKVGEDLMSAFTIFNRHFDNPLYVGTLRDIVAPVVIKSWKLKIATEKHEKMHKRGSSSIEECSYNRALRYYASVNIQKSAVIFWKILNDETISTRLKNKACNFLAHMITIAPFATLVHFLKNQRSQFIKRLSFPPTTEATQKYNTAVTKFVELDIQSSASSFWNTLFTSKNGSTLRKRSIEMLMFAINLKWECDGFDMIVGSNYIYNAEEKDEIPFHVDFGDMYYALEMNANDMARTLQKAAYYSSLELKGSFWKQYTPSD